MADDTDELASPDAPSAPVSWPLVERRRDDRTPPGGIDRRDRRSAEATEAPVLRLPPLWPFRLAALAGAWISAADELSDGWRLAVVGALVTVYGLARCVRPIRPHDEPATRRAVALEIAFHALAVLATTAWASPFALCLIPVAMLAAFSCGARFAGVATGLTVVAVTTGHVVEFDAAAGARDGAIWAMLLAVVVFTGGVTHRAATDAAREQRDAGDRMARLAEANSLLFALQRVAQTLPASLDLDDVLDTTLRRVRAMIPHDAIAVYLVDADGAHLHPIRSAGLPAPRELAVGTLPPGVQRAFDSPRTVRLDTVGEGEGVTATARSGLYAVLRARGSTVGLVAVESDRPGAFGQQQAEILHGLTEPFGVAIDNARMFRHIRTLAADEERARIARDLHDHIGSSLALAGFEVDRALALASGGGEVEPVLSDLRTHISAVVRDVRETLSDLRTEVTDERDLGTTVLAHLERVAARSGLQVTPDVRVSGRLPLVHERELWQIAREAVTNVERHAHARRLTVVVRESADGASLVVRDDGAGLPTTGLAPDRFGITGMRERADRIGARLTIRSEPGSGTEVRVDLRDVA